MQFLLHTDLKQNYKNHVDGSDLVLRGSANYLQFADGSYGMNFSAAEGGDPTTRLTYSVGATPGSDFRQGFLGARLKAKHAFTAGMTGIAPDPFGTTKYYSFDGTAKYVDSPSSTLPTTGNFSLSVFVRFNAFTIVAGQGTPYTAGGNGVLLLAAAGGVTRFTINTGTGTQLTAEGPTVSLNQWVHLGVSVNRAGTATVYVNGVAGTPVDITSKSNDLGTGAIRLGRQGSAGIYADARMFGFKIFNSALSANDFAALSANGLNGATGDILDWTLQDSDPTTTPDASGNGRTGSKSGSISTVDDAETPTGGLPAAFTGNLIAVQDNANIADAFQLRVRYSDTGLSGLYLLVQRAASTASSAEVGLPGFTIAKDEEYHVGVRWCTHPKDPDGNISLHWFLNGRCVFVQWGFRAQAQLPQQVTDIYIGGFNDAGNHQPEHTMQDVVVCSGYVSDRDIYLMANRQFDWDDGYRPSVKTLKRPSVQVTEIDRTNFTKAMRFYDKWDQSLWAVEREYALPTDKSKLYQTYDMTGQTGWTLRWTTPDGADRVVRDIATSKTHRFVSAPGVVYRSVRANYTWTKVLDLDGGSGGNYATTGWGLDCWGTYVVAGEYRVPATEGGQRVLVSADNGDTWNTRLTLPVSTSSSNMHIHGVAYDPYTGWLWCSYGDDIDQIGYSKDHGVTWTWLFGEADHPHQGLGFAFTERYVVCGLDSLNGQSLLVFDKRSQRLHNWTGSAETGGNFFNRNCFLAGPGGGAYASAVWGISQFDDGRILCHFYNTNVGSRKNYDAIFDPELQEFYIIRDDISTYDDSAAVFCVGNSSYFGGRYRIDLDSSLGVPSADVTLAKIDQSVAITATVADDTVTKFKADPQLGTADGGLVANVGKIPRAATAKADGEAVTRNKVGTATASTLTETLS